MSTKDEASRVRFGVDTDFDGRINLKIHTLGEEGKKPPQEFILEPEVYLNLLRDLNIHVLHGLEMISRQQSFGDCEECLNIRLVDAPASGGRTQKVHCRACIKGSESLRPFVRPRIGGGVR